MSYIVRSVFFPRRSDSNETTSESDDSYETCEEILGIENKTIQDWGDIETHHYAWVISGLFTLLAIGFSIFLMIRHYQYYFKPQYQRHVVRIILMVPIYAVTSWLSFRYYHHSVYFEVVRDCYEAFAIYEFFALCMQYLGPDKVMQNLSLHGKPKQRCAFPLNFILFDPDDGKFLDHCKYGALQYVVIRPATTIISLILESLGMLCPESLSPTKGHVYMLALNFVSVTVAMYALVQFYIVVRGDISRYNPIPKFLSIKFVLFFSFWQTIGIAVLSFLGVIKATQY